MYNSLMKKFLETLKGEGYSQNSLRTYERALNRFFGYLKFYGFDEKNFDVNSLIYYLSTTYRSKKSILTALSAIRQYLLFRGIRVPRFKVDFSEDLREFKEIDELTFDTLEEQIKRVRKQHLKYSLKLMVYLGLKPSQILRLRKFSFKFLNDIPAIEEGTIKRLILDKGFSKEIEGYLSNFSPDESFFKGSYGSLKVTSSKLFKKFGLTLYDFRDNYALSLMKKGLPFDIVVEYSGISLERASYIYRVSFLKSKIDIVEGKLKDF